MTCIEIEASTEAVCRVPLEKQQKAASGVLVREVTKNTWTARLLALSQLVVLCYYFAMCSCDDLRAPKAAEERTKVFLLAGVNFYLNGAYIPHNHSDLHATDFVSIMLEDQKMGSAWRRSHSSGPERSPCAQSSQPEPWCSGSDA